MNIAIIGAGIGGTMAASFLRDAFGDKVTITVYEQASQVGGRVAHMHFAGEQIETGATLIHSSNQHLSRLMAQLGLESVVPHDGEPQNRTVGIWNGRSFLLQTSSSALRTNLTMLWRYRRSLLRLQRLVQEFIKPWEQIYQRQADGEAWQSPVGLLQALGLFKMTQISSYDYFSQQGISQRFIKEFVDGASRVNYGQDGQINAFANAVSLTGAGLAGGELFSVKGGNRLLCEKGLAAAGVDLRLQTAVSPTAPIYKLLSRQPLADEKIATLFHNPRDVERITWHAYTKLKPTTAYPPFELAPNLYYVNAMETAVSTMETEAVASRNIVNLIKES